MNNLIVVAGAISLVVILGILAKIHGQISELMTILKNVTLSIKKDTRSLTDRTTKIEGLVEYLYEKQNQPERSEDIKWKG